MTDRDPGHAMPIDPEDAFTAVANDRRRRILLSLEQSNGPLTARELAVEIAAIENLVDPSDVTGKQRMRVYISITQTHLDTLDELDIVDYDERGKQVAPTDATEPLAKHIRRIETSCYKPGDSNGSE